MFELINHAYSTCSQKVRLCLHEKGLDFRDRQINFRTKDHLSPEYLKLNPNGVVPTLLHDGRPVIDSSVIMEYLEEVSPEIPLSPSSPYERADMRAWLRFFEEVPTVAVRFPSFNRAFVRHYKHLDQAEFEREAAARPLRNQFYRQMGREGFSEDKIKAALDSIRRTVERMENRLANSEWLCGERITIADFCVTPSIDRMNDLGYAELWNDLPNVSRWYTALQQRPSFIKTYYPGTRLSETYEDLKQAPPQKSLA